MSPIDVEDNKAANLAQGAPPAREACGKIIEALGQVLSAPLFRSISAAPESTGTQSTAVRSHFTSAVSPSDNQTVSAVELDRSNRRRMALVCGAARLAFETVCPLSSGVQLITTVKSLPALSLPAFKTNRQAGHLDAVLTSGWPPLRRLSLAGLTELTIGPAGSSRVPQWPRATPQRIHTGASERAIVKCCG